MKGQSTLFSSESDEWRTPRELFKRLDWKFSFVCDLAASEENALCKNFYTKEKSALDLTNDWYARNFLNPPYSCIEPFAQRANAEAVIGNLTIMLVPARTDTRWFHLFVNNKWHVEFLRGRLRFSDSKNSAPFPSMLVYFGITA